MQHLVNCLVSFENNFQLSSCLVKFVPILNSNWPSFFWKPLNFPTALRFSNCSQVFQLLSGFPTALRFSNCSQVFRLGKGLGGGGCSTPHTPVFTCLLDRDIRNSNSIAEFKRKLLSNQLVHLWKLLILLVNLSAKHDGYELFDPGLYLSYNYYWDSLNWIVNVIHSGNSLILTPFPIWMAHN